MRNARRYLLAAVAAAALLGIGAAAYWRFGRAVDIPVAVVAQGSVAARVVGPGTVQARVPVTVSARISSTVLQVHADVGDAVRAGQPLATLDDRDLSARRGVVTGQQEALQRNTEGARAALVKAQADLDLARSRQRRDAELLAQGYVSAAVLDASNAALGSAAAGVDIARATLAAREADARTLSQEAQAVVGRVLPGQAASIRLRSGEVLSGKVARIARQSDAATRELEVNVAFDAVPERFAIDQEAEVRIDVGEDRGLLVPLAALTRDKTGRQGVLVIADGRTRFQPVETGGADDKQVLIRQGLAAGDRVAAKAAGLTANVRVR